jgi:signal peptidase I
VGPEDLEIETLMDNGSDRLTGEQRYSLRRSLRELLLVLLAAALLAGGSMFFFRAALVRGSSMEPTLRDGDCIFVQTAGYHQPRQGDIVAIRAKDRQGKHLIKRIIAREGDTVQIDFEAGMVFVNGQLLEEPYINEATTLSGDIPFPVTVPPGCFFVLGDNRNHSQDSRSSALGFVPLKDIEGRAVFRFAPLSRFGPIEDRRP